MSGHIKVRFQEKLCRSIFLQSSGRTEDVILGSQCRFGILAVMEILNCGLSQTNLKLSWQRNDAKFGR